MSTTSDTHAAKPPLPAPSLATVPPIPGSTVSANVPSFQPTSRVSVANDRLPKERTSIPQSPAAPHVPTQYSMATPVKLGSQRQTPVKPSPSAFDSFIEGDGLENDSMDRWDAISHTGMVDALRPFFNELRQDLRREILDSEERTRCSLLEQNFRLHRELRREVDELRAEVQVLRGELRVL